MRSRTLGMVLVGVGLVGLAGTLWMATVGGFANPTGTAGGARCNVPALPGHTVDVTLSDMGGNMMQSGHMMNVSVSPATTPAGEVSFRVTNGGRMVHEMVVLPLPPGGAGTRAVGPSGRVDESQSLGEASNTCGEGAGTGIEPSAVSWVSLRLSSGRYELICDEPYHYAMGMFTEFGVL